MTDSRERILKHIQQALGRTDTAADFDQAFAGLTQPSELPVQPPLSEDLVAGFMEAATTGAAEVHTITSLGALPQWLCERAQQLKQLPALALSPQLADLATQLPSFELDEQITRTDAWGVVTAFAGIAETGTVVSVSENCPSSLLFLVERLIVVVDKADILAYQEDAWARLRQRFGGALPRTVNLITGPSRTADVEQIIQLGAHGPRWVDYVVFG